MGTILYILTLIAPSPAMTVDELADYQAHAEAARRLQIGEVEQAGIKLARPDWAFTPAVDFDAASPFAEE